jgi:tRNA modification GTPase
MHIKSPDDTICALSTPAGIGALALIRVSGREAITFCESIFSKPLAAAKSHSALYGKVLAQAETIDEVVLALFRGPRSFTGEDTVEISCHGSTYIQQQVLKALLDAGCRMAEPGEFSMRAFAHGKMDLSQTEAIADLIACSTAASHQLAMNQMRGGFSKQINDLRQKLLDFASLIELELDFSEEDVEFAQRDDLKALVHNIDKVIGKLIESFATGHAIKNGIPVAILGAPNMGKSTLLNALLEDDKAIVSDIAGTTRDTIEDEMTIGGVRFRFIDTAGIRDTSDVVESLGIARTYEKAGKSAVILYLVDALENSPADVESQLAALQQKVGSAASIVALANKSDKMDSPETAASKWGILPSLLPISAANGSGLDALRERLLEITGTLQPAEGDVVVSNLRHFDALRKAQQALLLVSEGLESGTTGDFLAVDIRRALYHLGEITGEITTDDLLGNIFSRFCIGK